MNLLAFDTSSNACSVAVRWNGEMVERHVVEPKRHTSILLPMIEDALDECQVQLGDLDGIVLGNGPGSFIGMRIGASVAQGLAFGAGFQIRPVSSLAAVAAEVMATESATSVAVAQDARMDEVYLGLYRADGNGLPDAVTAEKLQQCGPIEWPDNLNWVAAGEGWGRYPQFLEANRATLSAESAVGLPRATYLLSLGEHVQPVEPHLLEPAYLRTKVAEPPKPA